MRRIGKHGLIFAIIIVVVAFAFGGRVWGWSALGGAAISLVSFAGWMFLFRSPTVDRPRSRVLMTLVGVGKLLLIGFLLWVVVTKLPIEPLAFLAGLSSIPASIFWTTLVRG